MYKKVNSFWHPKCIYYKCGKIFLRCQIPDVEDNRSIVVVFVCVEIMQLNERERCTMSQKVTINLERVWINNRPYLRQPLENNVRLRPPTKKEMAKHAKLYRKQVQTAIIRGKY